MDAGSVKDGSSVMYTRSVAEAGSVTKVNALGEHRRLVGDGLSDRLWHTFKCMTILTFLITVVVQ